MTNFKKYKHKESGEIVEAKAFKCLNDEIYYCVYQESSGENIWGQDYKEKDFLEQYEPIK